MSVVEAYSTLKQGAKLQKQARKNEGFCKVYSIKKRP